MGDLATAVLVGRLTRDAELKYTSSGQSVCHFAVATSSRVRKNEQWVDEPSFWEVDFWGKRAESLNQYLTKGKLVAVSGPMRIDKWEKDGQSRQKTLVTAQDVQLLGSGPGGGVSGGPGESGYDRGGRPAQTGEPGAGYGRPQSARPNGGQASPGSQVRGDDFTDDIPF